MRFASQFATALSAAAARSHRPNGWQLVGVCAYWGIGSINSSDPSSKSKLK
jgi:hypothetical protein